MDLEGDLACQEFVHHYAQCPDIHLIIVAVSEQEFWRDVERSAAEGFPFVLRVDRPAEVCDLGEAEAHDNVFRLQVAMDNTVAVHFVQPLTDAFHDGLPFLLTQLAFDLEYIVELPSRAVLQQQVKVELILEEGVQLDKVDMVQKRLYLDLPDKLLYKLLFDDGLFLDDLDGQQEACPFVS